MSEAAEQLNGWSLVRVKWLDSRGWHGWNALSVIKERHSLECVSVGWLIEDDDDRVVLVSHIQDTHSKEPMCDGNMTIPKPSIIEIKTL